MAEAERRAEPVFDARDAHFVLVEGRFYEALNDWLIEGAKRAIAAAGATLEIVTVPGALEIPIAIAMIADQARVGARKADGFVALGAVIRGETLHFEIVAMESSRALIDLATRERLAFGNGILTVENQAQAEVRADPTRGDKGGDAARAALALYQLKKVSR